MQFISDQTREVPNYQRKRYRPIEQAWGRGREYRLIETLLTSYDLPGCSVLDVPCGSGHLFSLYSHLGMDFMGVDLSPKMLQAASQRRHVTRRDGVLRSNIFNLPFTDASFDVVICLRLFHHAFHDAERQRLVSELARVSRRYVMLSYYHFDWFHTWSNLMRRRNKRRVTTILSEIDFDVLVWANGLERLSTHSLLRYGHMQMLTVLEKA